MDGSGNYPASDGSAITNVAALTAVTATTAVSVSGSINANQLTGALPAIDGSNLTGVTGVPTSTNDIGSTILARVQYNGILTNNHNAGDTIDGSRLLYADIRNTAGGGTVVNVGTWRCQGKSVAQFDDGGADWTTGTCWVRIL